jgi:hypothetical protein
VEKRSPDMLLAEAVAIEVGASIAKSILKLWTQELL